MKDVNEENDKLLLIRAKKLSYQDWVECENLIEKAFYRKTKDQINKIQIQLYRKEEYKSNQL